MTQEEKQLLLKDLCARLPYHVKVHYTVENFLMEIIGIDIISETVDILEWGKHRFSAVPIEDVKPYLRPMESMTAEERDEYIDIKKGECNGCVLTGKGDSDTEFLLVDWFNKYYFDYRGLIPMNLALPAIEGIYNIK